MSEPDNPFSAMTPRRNLREEQRFVRESERQAAERRQERINYVTSLVLTLIMISIALAVAVAVWKWALS